MAGYALRGSYSTVQVLSATLTEDVVYCTIETSPSGVVASMPVSQVSFDNNQAAEQLAAFADGIEQIMNSANIDVAAGSQTIDGNGLLADNVTFVVFYTPPGTGSTQITAEAVVPVGLLNQSDPAIAKAAILQADAIVNAVYDNLKHAAGG